MIRVQGLVKRWTSAVALDAVSFELPENSCTAVLGASGAGKSTLLRCLVGLEPFDAGEVQIDGVIFGPKSRKGTEQLRGRTGLVFQSFELFPHLSVLENCTLAPMRVRGLPRTEARETARGLLGKLGLSSFESAWPEELSGGRRQRVAIARALSMQPKVLFYDEPTSALDPSLRGEVKETLRAVGGTGITQVVVTHDVAFAREACDRVLVMEGGRLVEEGARELVFGAPGHEATRRLLR